jgi:hypothetical protein
MLSAGSRLGPYARDGQRFLIPAGADATAGPESATVIINWRAGIKR